MFLRVSNIYLKVNIEKNWRSQNFDFLILKNSSPGQFSRSSNSPRYIWILKDIIFDQAYNTPFQGNLESIQYNGSLATTGVVRSNSKEKLHQKLCLESLQQKR